MYTYDLQCLNSLHCTLASAFILKIGDKLTNFFAGNGFGIQVVSRVDKENVPLYKHMLRSGSCPLETGKFTCQRKHLLLCITVWLIQNKLLKTIIKHSQSKGVKKQIQPSSLKKIKKDAVCPTTYLFWKMFFCEVFCQSSSCRTFQEGLAFLHFYYQTTSCITCPFYVCSL